MNDKLYEARWEDVLHTLDDESVDLIYTDPPYGKKYISNIPGDKRWFLSDGTSESKFHKHLLNDEQGAVDWQALAEQFYRLAKPNAYFVLHCDLPMIMYVAHHFQDAGFRTKGQFIWKKNSAVGGDTKGAMKRDYEPVLYFCKGPGQLKPIQVNRKGEMVERDRISESEDWVFPLRKAEKMGFPTQKPIALAERVINLTTDEHAVVLDCFAGSGTVPRAAKNLNRRYIAVEADPQWIPKIEKRLGQEAEKAS